MFNELNPSITVFGCLEVKGNLIFVDVQTIDYMIEVFYDMDTILLLSSLRKLKNFFFFPWNFFFFGYKL